MFLEEGVDSSLDFYLGQVCVGKMWHLKKEGERKALKSIVDDPFNERFDSKFPKNSVCFNFYNQKCLGAMAFPKT
jgi:hypothetical protein